MDILFLVTLILVTLFGLGFLFIPAQTLMPFGVTLNPTATVFARLFGSTLLGYAILVWFARKFRPTEFRRAVAYVMGFYFLVSTLLILLAQLAGLLNPLGWILVALHAAFTIWYGYFLFRRPRRHI